MASTIPPEAKRVQFTSFTSEDYAPLDEDKLFVFYCMHCSSHAIICDVPLFHLPRRNRTGCHAVDQKSRIFKHQMVSGIKKAVKRPNGLELQSRYYCSNCGLFLAYYIQDSVSSEITDDEAQIFYLLEGGLCARPSVFLHQQQIMIGSVPDCIESLSESRGLLTLSISQNEDATPCVTDINSEAIHVSLQETPSYSPIVMFLALCLNISSSSIFVEEAPLEGLPLSGLESGISFDRQSLSSLAPSILQRSNTKWIATIYDLNVNSIYFRLLEACL